MKYAVIGGSLSGLASRTVSLLAERGYYVFALDIRNTEREEGNIRYIKTDLTDNADIERARKIVEAKTDRVDFLSSFAGCVILGSLFENAEGKAERSFALNFLTVFNINRIFMPLVINAKGTVAVISSEYGRITAIPLHGYYPMTKHAIECYADSLRREIGKSGVRVVTIRPGAFRTAMQAAVEGQFDELLSETELYRKPLLRMKGLMTGELRKAKDPDLFARKLLSIIEKKHPNAHWNISNSLKMKLLTILPSFIQDRIFLFFF